PAARSHAERQDDAGRVFDILSKLGRVAVRRAVLRQILECLPALVGPLRPPGLLVERPKLADLVLVRQDHDASGVWLAAVRRLRGGLDDQADVLHWDRGWLQAANRTVGEHCLANRHREAAMVVAHRSPPVMNSVVDRSVRPESPGLVAAA